MAGSTKKKPYASAVFMGAISVALYVLLFLKQDMINTYFAKGGMYAFLPVLAAFVFSFVHGTFTGNFWTIVGVEASKKHGEGK